MHANIQIITVANILSIDIHELTDEIASHILLALSDLAAFKDHMRLFRLKKQNLIIVTTQLVSTPK